MGKFIIEGQRSLGGKVRINGAKNSVLKLMVAALLGQGTFSLENVPQITDVNTMIGVLRALGVQVQFQAPRMQLSVSSVREAPHKNWSKRCGLRSSYGSALGSFRPRGSG